MSGHSKWSKVKHQKAGTDAVKSREFTRASRGVTVAVSEGAGITDPEKNFRLRLAIEKARAVNMPKENIQRAIDRAVASGAAAYEQIVYEGYGPAGVAVIVETATDNRQRTVANVKHAFDRSGGSLAVQGAVSFLFKKVSVIVVAKTVSFEAIFEAAVAAGATDVVETEGEYEVYTAVGDMEAVKQALIAAGCVVDNAEIIMKVTAPIDVTDETKEKIEELVERLNELDDVQKVFTSID
jgi:YebC/PmpR family DNA-binding regulatory protein